MTQTVHIDTIEFPTTISLLPYADGISALLEDQVGYCAAFHRFLALGAWRPRCKERLSSWGRLSLGTWTAATVKPGRGSTVGGAADGADREAEAQGTIIQ